MFSHSQSFLCLPRLKFSSVLSFYADFGPPVWPLPRWEAALLPADTGRTGPFPGKMGEYEPSAVQTTPFSGWWTSWRAAGLRRAGQGPVWAPWTAGHTNQRREWWGLIRSRNLNSFFKKVNELKTDLDAFGQVNKVHTFIWHCFSFCLTVVQMDICKQKELLTAAKSGPWWVSELSCGPDT